MGILMFRTGVRFPTSPFHGDALVSTGHKGLICWRDKKQTQKTSIPQRIKSLHSPAAPLLP